jgi:hypothetical protein
MLRCAPILHFFMCLSSWIMPSHARCHLPACGSFVRLAWPFWNALHQKETNFLLITYSSNTARSSLWIWVSIWLHVFRKLITPCSSTLAQLSSLAATVTASYALMTTAFWLLLTHCFSRMHSHDTLSCCYKSHSNPITKFWCNSTTKLSFLWAAPICNMFL